MPKRFGDAVICLLCVGIAFGSTYDHFERISLPHGGMCDALALNARWRLVYVFKQIVSLSTRSDAVDEGYDTGVA